MTCIRFVCAVSMCLLELRFGRGNANASMAEQCETWERNGSNPRSNHNMPQYATIIYHRSFCFPPKHFAGPVGCAVLLYYLYYLLLLATLGHGKSASMWVFNGVTIHTIHSCHVQLAAFLGLKRQQDAMNTSKSCLVRAAFQSNKMMQNCGWNH